MTDTQSPAATLARTRLNISQPPGQLARIGLIALLSGAAAISFTPIFVRLSQIGPTATGFWRMALALPVFWLWLFLPREGGSRIRRPSSSNDYRRLAAAGLFLAGDLAVWQWAVNITTVANATLLVNFAPVFVTLGSWLLFRSRVRLTFLLGLATALTGASILVSNSFHLSLQYLLGDIMALIAAIFYAGYILAVKDLRDDFSAVTIMAWSGIVTGITLLPIAILSGESLIPFSIQGWAVLLGLALICHTSGQGLIAYALAHLPASFSSVTLLIQPVLSTMLAWLILREAIGRWQALGGVIVLVGIYLARRGSRAG